MTVASPSAPSGQEGELAAVIVGAWQHTHIDSGNGFESLDDKDIRYVFPSASRLIYCQHVPGITEHAENASAFELQVTSIVLPAAPSGYEVLAWDADTMLWLNERDGSHYLLVRR